MEAQPKNRAFGPGAHRPKSYSYKDGAKPGFLARNNEAIHLPGPPQPSRIRPDHGAPIPAQTSPSDKGDWAPRETFPTHLSDDAQGAPMEWLWSTLPTDLVGPQSQREPRFIPEFHIGTVPRSFTQHETSEIASTGEYHLSDDDFFDDGPDESWDEFKDRLADTIRQMMYVSGETAEPPVETTSIIEDIVRQQVIELLRNCTELASRRGSKSIGINDLIFQIRHDQAKVSRLRTFLSWKDVRKNVKDSDDKGADADLAGGEDPVEGTAGNDEAAKKNKKAKVGLPWEPSSFYSVEVPERDDEEDEEEEEMNYITLQRLRKADERTKAMTKEEYVTWSEYRQASFTYRKGKRFREWAGFGIVTDSKPSDDIVDILGFLTFEMVQTLTEMALKVKEQEDLARALNGGDKDGTTKKRKHEQALFDPPSEGKTPIEPRHVQEGSRRLQQRPKKSRAMLNGTKLPQHTPLNIF